MKRSLIFLLFIFCLRVSISQTTSVNVLYLNSYHTGYPWSDSISKGVRTALHNHNINLYIECLDAKRLGQQKFEIFYNFLENKYTGIKPDLVITSDNDAFDFVLQYENKLFPKIPVVFCGIANPEDYKFEGTNKYGIIESDDPNVIIGELEHILPQAKSLLFISDNTTSGSIMNKRVEQIRKLHPSLKINVLSEIDVDEITKIVASGEKGDIVYVAGVNLDKYGNLIDFTDLFPKIAEVSPKPVFSNTENAISLKFVGGNANRGFTQGYEAGLLALKLLRDSARTNIKHINKVKEEYVFDYRLLKKFGIRESNLPANTRIVNRPIVEYGRYIILLLLAILVLTVIIVVLIILNRKRLIAEKKVKEQLNVINERNQLLENSYLQLSDLNCELEEANAQLMNLNASLEEAKSKAEESEKLKSSFLANLSHEIRTPLNAILGFSSLLTESKVSDKSKKNYNEIIQSNSESLLVLIDDILDFSKIEAGQIKIQHEPVLVNMVLQELYDYFRHKTTDKLKLKLSGNINKQQITILTDKTRFRQILNNLLTNAFKFTEEGTIEIGYELINNFEIKFFVKDTGIGIDPKYHGAVFERFRKLENDHDRFYSGSGLGLAICRRLTELLGGKIWVEGELGKGSCFCFTHPDYTILNSSYEEKNIQKTKADYNWKGKKIAIAEDEENNYLLLERIITKYGAEVIWFRDGSELVNYFSGLKENEIDLILMDIKMPVMDGYEALEKIKTLVSGMVVIAQTAHAMSEDIVNIKNKGFQDYVSKPINIDTLREKLNKYLSPQ